MINIRKKYHNHFHIFKHFKNMTCNYDVSSKLKWKKRENVFLINMWTIIEAPTIKHETKFNTKVFAENYLNRGYKCYTSRLRHTISTIGLSTTFVMVKKYVNYIITTCNCSFMLNNLAIKWIDWSVSVHDNCELSLLIIFARNHLFQNIR